MIGHTEPKLPKWPQLFFTYWHLSITLLHACRRRRLKVSSLWARGWTLSFSIGTNANWWKSQVIKTQRNLPSYRTRRPIRTSLSRIWSFFYREYFLKHSLCPPLIMMIFCQLHMAQMLLQNTVNTCNADVINFYQFFVQSVEFLTMQSFMDYANFSKTN